jgi:hypothetical protein
MLNVPEITKVLVTDGNLGFVPTGLDLYAVNCKPGQYRSGVPLVYNVQPKRLVAWLDKKDGSVPKTIAPADITAADLPFLHIGVGYDGNGDGLSEAIREFGPDHAEACTITDFNAVAPQCGIPEIKAIYPGCLACEPLTLRIKVSDSATRSFAPWHLDAATFVASYTPDCSVCEGCDKTVTCEEYICGLVDQINGDEVYKIGDSLYPDYMGDTIKRPFKAVKLHENWFSYCIVPETSACACEECTKIPAITEFVVDGQTFTLTNSTSPADNTQTLIEQLSYIADQIESKIKEVLGKHGGFVTLSRGQGPCCGIQLHVVTCDPLFTITGLTPCPAIDPKLSFTVSGICKQCDSVDTPEERTCGLAIIADMDRMDCDCYMQHVPAYFGRNIDIEIVSGGKVAKYTKYKTLQEQKLPSGFGAEVQAEEYRQVAGYNGYDYSNGNNPRMDNLGLPGPDARIRKAVTADCNKSYCLYEVGGRFEREFGRVNEHVNRIIKTRLWVPQADLVTQAEVEALMVVLRDLNQGRCKLLTAYGCDGNQL